MLKYNINGTIKENQNNHCNICKDGSIYKHYENLINTNKNTNPYTEVICETCMTKYKIPNTIFPLVTDITTPHKYTLKDVDDFELNLPTQDNIILYTLKIAGLYHEQHIDHLIIHKDYEIIIKAEDDCRLQANKNVYQKSLYKLIQKILEKENQKREQATRLTTVQVDINPDIKFDMTKVNKNG